MAFNNKEAVAIVLDVGRGMTEVPPGEQSHLQVSLDAINMFLQRKLFSESKDEVSLILFGTPDTANDLAAKDGYQNITVARPLGPVDWDLLKYIQNDVTSSDISADFLDALVVAMDHLTEAIKGKKGFGTASKRVILFSDVSGEFGDDQLDDIMASFKESNFELTVIGPDLDDEDDTKKDDNTANGHAKPKTPQQRAGETLLRHIIENIDGESYTFSEVLPALSCFLSRQVRSAAWKAQLEIGPSLKIPVCLFTRVKEVKAKSFKNVYAKDADAGIERLRTYHLNDDEETEVEKSNTADGHRYGSTLVPFSEDDKEAMKYKTEKCFKVLGFTKSENVKRYQVMGDSTWICTAEQGDKAAVVALSAIIHALYETNMVAIVRRVYAGNGAVKLGCLIPQIKIKCEYLVYLELPFVEDLRQFTFGSLALDDSSAAVVNKKFIPTEEQLSLIDELIDTMDLSSAGKAEDEKIEALKPKLTFNPHLQRLFQCLQHRAMNPDEDLPELSPAIAASLNPPSDVAEKTKAVTEKMKAVFKLEPVAKKEVATGDNIFRDTAEGEPAAKKPKLTTESDLSGGLPELLKPKVTEVGSTNPVEDFVALIAQKDEDKFNSAHRMMQDMIVKLVVDSFGTQFYPKAMDCLKSLRSESIKNGEPTMFNDFLLKLKDQLSKENRTNFWQEFIVQEKLSLITKVECEESKSTQEEADQLLCAAPKVEEKKPTAEDTDANELLDELE